MRKAELRNLLQIWKFSTCYTKVVPLPWQIHLQLPDIKLPSDSFTSSLKSHMFSPIIHPDSEQKARVFYTCQRTLPRSMDSKPFLGGQLEHSHRGTALMSFLATSIPDARPAWRKSTWPENSLNFLSLQRSVVLLYQFFG